MTFGLKKYKSKEKSNISSDTLPLLQNKAVAKTIGITIYQDHNSIATV